MVSRKPNTVPSHVTVCPRIAGSLERLTRRMRALARSATKSCGSPAQSVSQQPVTHCDELSHRVGGEPAGAYSRPSGPMKRATDGAPFKLPCRPLPASTDTSSSSREQFASVLLAAMTLACMIQKPVLIDRYSSVLSSFVFIFPMRVAVHTTRLSGWSHERSVALSKVSSVPSAPAARRWTRGSTSCSQAPNSGARVPRAVVQMPLSAISIGPSPPKYPVGGAWPPLPRSAELPDCSSDPTTTPSLRLTTDTGDTRPFVLLQVWMRHSTSPAVESSSAVTPLVGRVYTNVDALVKKLTVRHARLMGDCASERKGATKPGVTVWLPGRMRPTPVPSVGGGCTALALTPPLALLKASAQTCSANSSLTASPKSGGHCPGSGGPSSSVGASSGASSGPGASSSAPPVSSNRLYSMHSCDTWTSRIRESSAQLLPFALSSSRVKPLSVVRPP